MEGQQVIAGSTILIQRDSRVWAMPMRELLGTVRREEAVSRGWVSRCDMCSTWSSAVSKTRKEAVDLLIHHWDHDEVEEEGT